MPQMMRVYQLRSANASKTISGLSKLMPVCLIVLQSLMLIRSLINQKAVAVVWVVICGTLTLKSAARIAVLGKQLSGNSKATLEYPKHSVIAILDMTGMLGRQSVS